MLDIAFSEISCSIVEVYETISVFHSVELCLVFVELKN